ncbi:MAG TPA: hypothetical protein VEQ16_06005 [Acidocella sp.]|nr:hypothetical protein [Acidocella sp.]
MSDRSGKIVGFARKLDDFIIDNVLQPGVNRADWHLGIDLHNLARLCAVLGAGAGLIWVHGYDRPYSADFWQDLFCLLVMSSAAFLQIRANEASAPRRAALAPAARLTGLLWRSLWLADLALLPSQWPVEAHGELLGNFAWTVLLVLPYWIICCRTVPPPERRLAGELRYATIPVQ